MNTRDKLAAWFADESHGLDWIGTDPAELADALLASDVLNHLRAEALREAAQEVEERIVHVSDDDVDSGGFETGMDVGCEIAYTEAVRRLRETADQIERDGDTR